MRGGDGQANSYLRALHVQRFVEARRAANRRFGEGADALWSTFRGDVEVISAPRMDVSIAHRRVLAPRTNTTPSPSRFQTAWTVAIAATS